MIWLQLSSWLTWDVDLNDLKPHKVDQEMVLDDYQKLHKADLVEEGGLNDADKEHAGTNLICLIFAKMLSSSLSLASSGAVGHSWTSD